MLQFHNVLFTIDNLHASILMEAPNVSRIEPPHSCAVHLQYDHQIKKLRTERPMISNIHDDKHLQKLEDNVRRFLILKQAFKIRQIWHDLVQLAMANEAQN